MIDAARLAMALAAQGAEAAADAAVVVVFTPQAEGMRARVAAKAASPLHMEAAVEAILLTLHQNLQPTGAAAFAQAARVERCLAILSEAGRGSEVTDASRTPTTAKVH